ncbi:MAG: hypothetical protein R3C44_05860 [Chloroflexota bacterium]
MPGFPGAGIEQTVPQALIYGWVLQFGFAFIPYFFYRLFLPQEPARLGGSYKLYQQSIWGRLSGPVSS